jgi:PTH1 family peptidyl-tRNA hydrolase
LDSKYWIILPKEQLSFQTVKLGALAEYKFKGRTFFFKAEYLHELNRESGTILDGQRKYSLENILVITDDLNLSFGTIRIKPKEVMEATTD